MSKLKVCENQCDQCLFSANRIVSLNRMAEIIKGCRKDDSHFECHKGSIVGVPVVCKGFFDNETSQMIRIAGRLNAIEFVNPETLIKENFKRK